MPALAHRVRRMTGRDPAETGRAATPLELLFDLTFVVAFGTAADELSHYLAEDHVATSLIAFAFVTFAISWAWINFSWFASAYDTDDWAFRLLTLLQMVGVLVLALGVADVFESVDAREVIHNEVLVGGYVVMRIAMVGQWLRAARQDPERRAASMAYAAWIVVAQAGWVVVAAAQLELLPMMLLAALLIAVEVTGPYVAETRRGGTPWHPHHIAERYGLLVIIALGEAILGTIAALGAIVGPDGPGWSVEAAVVGIGRRRAHLRHVVDLLRRPVRGAPRRAAASAPSAGATATSRCSARWSPRAPACTSPPTWSRRRPRSVPSPRSPPPRSRSASTCWRIFALYAYLTGTIDPFHYLLIALSARRDRRGAARWRAPASPSSGACWSCRSTPWVTVVGYELRGLR